MLSDIDRIFCLPPLRHNLDLHTLTAEVVESEPGRRGTVPVDTSGNSDLNITECLSGLEVFILLKDVRDFIGDVELVWVWVGRLGRSELVDSAGADLEVLLHFYSLSSANTALPNKSHTIDIITDIRRQILLIQLVRGFCGSLLSRSRRCSSCLLCLSR